MDVIFSFSEKNVTLKPFRVKILSPRKFYLKIAFMRMMLQFDGFFAVNWLPWYEYLMTFKRLRNVYVNQKYFTVFKLLLIGYPIYI